VAAQRIVEACEESADTGQLVEIEY